jgi:predicted Zn-dependent protease
LRQAPVALPLRLPTRSLLAARVHHQLATACTWWGLDSLAVTAFRDAVRAAPAWPQAHVDLADVLVRLGRWQEASRAFAEAGRKRPADSGIQAGLVLSLARAGRTGEALLALQRLLAREPDRAELHVLRGALLVRERRPVEAIRAFRWASTLGLRAPAARFALGEAVLGERAWQELLAAYRRSAAGAQAVPAQPPPGRSVLNEPPCRSRASRPVPPRTGAIAVIKDAWRRQYEALARAGLVRVRPGGRRTRGRAG